MGKKDKRKYFISIFHGYAFDYKKVYIPKWKAYLYKWIGVGKDIYCEEDGKEFPWGFKR